MSHFVPRRALSIACVAALALGGCAGERGYPSLARLPAERIAFAVPPAPPPAATPQPLPAELEARAGRLAAAVSAAHARFRALAGSARGPGALAELEVARGQTSLALAELDRLYADDRVAHAEDDGIAGPTAAPRPAAALLARLRDAALATLAEEDAVLASVRVN